MSIEDEIAAVKAAAEKKLRRLRERERKQQLAIDARVLTLLRSEHIELANQLEATARARLTVEAAQRSTNAKGSRLSRSVEPESGGDADAHSAGQSTGYSR